MTAKALLERMWRAARWHLFAAVALAVLLSCTEGISLALVFPLIALLGTGANPQSAPAAGPHTRMLFGWLTAAGIPHSFWLAVLLLVVLGSIGLLAQATGLLEALNLQLTLRLRESLSVELLHAILHADWLYLTRRRASDLTHLLTDEMLRVGTACGALTQTLANGMVALLMLLLAAWLAPWLTLAVLAALGLLLPWHRRVVRRLYADGESLSVRWSAIFDSAAGRIQNLKVVKAFGAETAELQLYSHRYRAVAGELMASEWRLQSSSRAFQLLVLAVLGVFIVAGSGPMHLPAATLLVFLFAFVRAMPRLNSLQSNLGSLAAQAPAFDGIARFLGECRQHTDPTERPASAEGQAPHLQHELTFRAIEFAYLDPASGTSKPVLQNVTFALPAGQITALSGASGAGKSTVADLILGLLEPQSGEIAADGEPITRTNARAWRRSIGYVSQDTVLFHDSIRANLLWARPDATPEQIAFALRDAQADFVASLPRGVDTVVGDRGVTLSHGQRQRLALARALLLEPELLILDEATNSLDLENEEKILRTVQSYRAGLTTLLISHRPSAVAVADRVLLLEDGCIRTT